MLQQTQVKTVIPYWERWMHELPTIHAAAKASPAKLHKLWEGLGYYTRVRNLQKAAQQILAQHQGQFPEDFPAVLALSGIGRYTAGAICSIAFHQPTPILDGNVIRVLTRIHGIATDPRAKKTNARLWQLAETLVGQAAGLASARSRRPGETVASNGACSALNQSLMELGALICTPHSPQCNLCPVNRLCVARKLNLQELIPYRGKRKRLSARRFIAFIVAREGKFLVRQRPEGVVNAHLWEFPNREIAAAEIGARPYLPTHPHRPKVGAPEADAPSQPDAFLPTTLKPLCTIKHSITRYRITLEAYRAELVKPNTKHSGCWRTPTQLHQLAFTSAHKKILNHL